MDLDRPIEAYDYPTVQNMVGTIDFGSEIDLEDVARRFPAAELNPRRFAATTLRLRTPRCTALLFSSGRLVCTGARSKNALRLAATRFADVLRGLGYAVRIKSFQIQNVVASASCGFRLSLELIANSYAEFSSYEPELFPGLIFRPTDIGCVFLLFTTGCLVQTGAKSVSEVYEAYEKIRPILARARFDPERVTDPLVGRRYLRANFPVAPERPPEEEEEE